jgi:hypothetical protein
MFLTARKSPKALFLTLLAALCLALFAPHAKAQSSTTGAIGGTVTDAGGALLPNAVITVTSADTQATRKVRSNSSGEFRIPELTPGAYSVTIVVDGFQTSVTRDITVTVGNTATITPKLTVGSVSDKVEVADTAPALHLNDSGITTTLDQNTIDNLPINGRRYSDFALLTPGVVSNSDGFGLLSFRGISYLLNNVTVDGADDNQAYFSEARGRTRSSYTVTQAAVQEFQVNTSNYSAEYGRAAGGVINTVTKSGSNQFHGEVFFLDRDNRIGGATNPYTQIYNFNEATGLNPQIVKPKDWRKQYGFGVGGALIKDKLFWFYAFDQEKRNFPGVARTSDPYDLFALASPLSGKESCANPGGSSFGAPYASYTNPSGQNSGAFAITANLSTAATIPASAPYSGVAIYPIGQSYQGNFAACALAVAIAGTTNASTPNYQAAMAYYNQGLGVLSTFFGAVPRFQDQTINFPKLDYQLNERNHISAQYNRLRDDSPNGIQTQTSNFYGRGSYGNDYVKADVGIFRVSSVLTNSVVNEFLAQYGRDMETEFPGGPLPAGPLPNEAPLLNPLSPGECSAPHGGGCLAEAPGLSVGYGYDAAGFTGGTYSGLTRFALPDERRLQLKDDVTWSYGKHTFKFGLDYNKVSDYINNLYNGYGTYDFDWAYSFIGDYLHATTGLGGTGYAGGNGTVYSSTETDYNYGLYSSFSQGYTGPSNCSLQTFLATGNAGTPGNVGARYLMATREYAGYATDNWRIAPRLTLTLGVRYEYEYIPNNATPNPDLIGSSATADGAYFAASGSKILPNTLAKPDDRNNVAPRVGFSLNVFGDGKTTLRGGYGIYFGRIINANVEQSYQNSGGPNSQVNISGLFPDATNTTNALCKVVFPQVVTSYQQAYGCAQATSSASSHPSVSYLDSHLQNPQVHEADLALEQDLGHGYVFGITYMGSFGRELDSANDVNLSLNTSSIIPFYVNNTVGISPPTPAVALPHGGKPAPLPTGSTTNVRVYSGTRIDPHYYRILRIASNVNSKYNALAFQINKRYSNGFSILSNYTWAHSLDYNPYIGTGIPGPTQLDPNDQSKDYGNSSLDVRNRFVGAVVYQPQTHLHGVTDYLLGGWRIAPVVQVQTGLPYTPYTSGYPSQSSSGVRSPNGAGGTSGRIDGIRRNQDYSPITAKADVRLGKNFTFDVNHYGLGRLRLEFFAEAFNLLNHQNITAVQTNAYNLSSGTLAGITPGSTLGPTGTVGGTAEDVLTLQPNFGTNQNSNSNYTYSPRQIQLAARLHF